MCEIYGYFCNFNGLMRIATIQMENYLQLNFESGMSEYFSM